MGNRVYPRHTPKPRAVLGWDGSDFRVVLIDAAGRLQVDVVNLDDIGDISTETTLDELNKRIGDETSPSAGTLAKLLTDILTAQQIIDGYANPTNTLLGYYDRYSETVSTEDASAPDHRLEGTQVASGEVWVVEAIAGANWTRQIDFINLEVNDGSVYIPMDVGVDPTAQEWVSWTGEIHLEYQDRCSIEFKGNTAGDDLYARFWGYKMKV